MKKVFYIIPGWGESTREKPFRLLSRAAASKGYKVIKFTPNWRKSFFKQVFPITKDDIIFGFSLGAFLAYIIAQKYKHKKVILASMSPILDMPYTKLKKLGKRKLEDIKKFRYGGVKSVFFAGENEIKEIVRRNKKMNGVFIPKTAHILNEVYINAIAKEL